MRRLITTASIAAVLLALPATSVAAPIEKPEGAAGCLADTGATLSPGTCKTAKGIDDATDIAISPDGNFAYAAGYSSNSIAIFSRKASSGELTQLDGTAGCIAWDGSPIAGCSQAAGLQGPSSLAMSPDGKNVYVTTFQLDPAASPPVISGQLTTFDRNGATGALTETSCASGSVTVLAMSAPPPSGCSNVNFGGLASSRNVPLGTASDVEVSPDGKSVVTSSFLPSAIINWDRAANGSLTPKECFGSSQTIFPTNGSSLGPLTDVCTSAGVADTGDEAKGMAYPLDVEFSPDGSKLYAAALGLEQDATEVLGVEVVPATDQPGSVAVFNRDGTSGALTQPTSPNGCFDDSRDPVLPNTTCSHRTALLNPYRVSVSPDSANVYVNSLNVFPPSGVAGPGPGELSQFNADMSQLSTPCLQEIGLPAGGLEPTTGCSLTALGLILPSDVAFSPDGKSAYVSSLFHSVGSYARAANGALTQDAPTSGCSIDPRNLIPGTELLAQLCQNTVPLNAPTSLTVSPDGLDVYATSGGFLTGNSSFGPAFAAVGVTSDDAITQLSLPHTPDDVPPAEPPAKTAKCQGKKPTIVALAGKSTKGTGKNDVIVGTSGDDKISGGGGNDKICGGGGDDKLKGGGGNDKLKGGGGDDKLAGGGGKDNLAGGGGKDKLAGGPGKDRCKGSGDDRLSGCE